jgi:hypothetical protein
VVWPKPDPLTFNKFLGAACKAQKSLEFSNTARCMLEFSNSARCMPLEHQCTFSWISGCPFIRNDEAQIYKLVDHKGEHMLLKQQLKEPF